MRIVNRTRMTLVGSSIRPADTFWRRLSGYLGRRPPTQGEGLLLSPCDAIHTMGMAFDLDVIFLDETGQVLRIIRGLKPWRITKKIPGARHVLEVPPGTVDETGTQVGDTLSWRPSRAHARG